MAGHVHNLGFAELDEHVDFVRRLARRLARDEAQAEDLAQETWVAALEGGPREAGGLRPWLARVLRNRAALGLRRGERRARREAAVARPDSVRDSGALLERIELHGRLVAAVLGLPEAYRVVVLRRFFEGEDTAAVAAGLGLPEATVRTRLRRALERLREKLRGDYGDQQRGAFAVALARLGDGSGPPAATSVATQVSGLSKLLVVFVVKKPVLVALVFALLLALVFLAEPWRSVGSGGPSLGGAEQVAAAETTAVGGELAAHVGRGARADLARDEVETSADGPEPGAPSTASAGDESARPTLEVRVVDALGHPIPRAVVRGRGLRSERHPGDWFGWHGQELALETDGQGLARLEYTPEFKSGSERLRTDGLAFDVDHPEYLPRQIGGHPLDAGACRVTLEQGAFLVVAGRLADSGSVVHEVVPHLSEQAELTAGPWQPVRDGRPSNDRIPAGRHALYLEWEREGTPWYSEVHEFEVVAGEYKELELELLPPRSLRGEFDARVPRPVLEGEVELNLYTGLDEEREPVLSRSFKAAVAADGSFELSALAPGAGEMIGICRGWTSLEFEVGEQDDELWLQQVEPAHFEGEPFVLAMRPSASCEVSVLDEAGEPLPGALAILTPNVYWSNGDADYFLGRTWRAESDSRGVARLENLPSGAAEWLLLSLEGHRMPLREAPFGGQRRYAWVDLRAGECTRVEVRLEALPGD